MSQVVQAAKICKCAAHVSAVVVVIVALVVSCRHVALCPTQGVQVGIRVSGGGCACLFPQPSAGQQVGDRVRGGACACFLPSAGQQVGDCVSGGACACLFLQLFAFQKRTHTTPTTTITTATNAAPPPTPLPACNFPMPSRPQASHSTSVSISHLLLLMTRFTTGLRVGEMFSSPLSSSQTSNCKSQIVYASRIPPRPRDDSMIGRRQAKEIEDLVG